MEPEEDTNKVESAIRDGSNEEKNKVISSEFYDLQVVKEPIACQCLVILIE